MKLITSLFLVASMAACAVHGAIDSDEITNLPGWDKPLPSKQYAGYLDVGNGKYLHYWFVESEGNPSQDPVVLWLNGGPGCSSMDGFFHEQGPFEVNSDLTLSQRPTRWNKLANMIWFDSPAGVGLSYATTKQGLIHNDTGTAIDNHEALKQFFKGFSEFSSNDFYITGESYAGIYVPTLAYQIHQHNSEVPLNLKGIMVGNGCTGTEVGSCSEAHSAQIHSNYLYRMGLYSNLHYQKIQDACGDFGPNKRNSEACKDALAEMHLEVGPVNVYDVLGECLNSGSASTDDDNYDDDTSGINNFSPYGRRPATAFEKEILQRAEAKATERGLPPSGPVECFNTGLLQNYLDQSDVRQAIHAKPVSQIGNWTICTNKITYTPTEPNEPKDIYPTLISNYRVTIYNGDADACVPFNDNEGWTSGMDIKVTKGWHAWYTSGTGNEHQVAGYVTEYDNDFNFVIVKGAGHMVPQFKPLSGYEMFQRYLNNDWSA